MRSQRHFEIHSIASPKAAQIETLIADLDRLIRLLDCDIATEEERTMVFDQNDASYPILARTLAARRDNLKNTVAALEQRFATTNECFLEPAAA